MNLREWLRLRLNPETIPGCLNWWGKVLYKVYSCLPSAGPPRRFSLEEVKELLAKTPFGDGTVEQRDGIAIKLKKRITEPE